MEYVELGYPLYKGMDVFPGLPEVDLTLRDRIETTGWNGSVLSVYLHHGTHVDAPWHYMGGDAPTIDQVPIENFIYERPLLFDIPVEEKNALISVEQLKKYGGALYRADLLIFNTHYYLKRGSNFMDYAEGFPALSPEAAEFIREELPLVKAVAIDTLSIEHLSFGKDNGYRTHKALLDPNRNHSTKLIYEDINPAPLVGRIIKRAFCTPVRVKGGDAAVCNLVAEVV